MLCHWGRLRNSSSSSSSSQTKNKNSNNKNNNNNINNNNNNYDSRPKFQTNMFVAPRRSIDMIENWMEALETLLSGPKVGADEAQKSKSLLFILMVTLSSCSPYIYLFSFSYIFSLCLFVCSAFEAIYQQRKDFRLFPISL